jgi:hypothetical protein
MAQHSRPTVRKPASKFAHLQKKKLKLATAPRTTGGKKKP